MGSEFMDESIKTWARSCQWSDHRQRGGNRDIRRAGRSPILFLYGDFCAAVSFIGVVIGGALHVALKVIQVPISATAAWHSVASALLALAG
jgi:hypothetical protein